MSKHRSAYNLEDLQLSPDEKLRQQDAIRAMNPIDALRFLKDVKKCSEPLRIFKFTNLLSRLEDMPIATIQPTDIRYICSICSEESYLVNLADLKLPQFLLRVTKVFHVF